MAHHQPVTKRALFPRCRHADIPAVPARPEPALPATRVAIPRQPVTQPRSSGFTSGARSRPVIGARAEQTRCAPTRPTRAPKAGISRLSAVIIAVPKRLACLPRLLKVGSIDAVDKAGKILHSRRLHATTKMTRDARRARRSVPRRGSGAVGLIVASPPPGPSTSLTAPSRFIRCISTRGSASQEPHGNCCATLEHWRYVKRLHEEQIETCWSTME
jgi:hypothetical protein